MIDGRARLEFGVGRALPLRGRRRLFLKLGQAAGALEVVRLGRSAEHVQRACEDLQGLARGGAVLPIGSRRLRLRIGPTQQQLVTTNAEDFLIGFI